MLSGASVDVLCEHNAQVSEGAKRFQVAEAWVSRILFSSLKVDKYSRLFRFPSFFLLTKLLMELGLKSLK